MNVVDSSALIDHFSAGSHVHKWISVFQNEESANTAAGIMMQNSVVQLDPLLALAASRISMKYKLPMADAIIYATTLANAAEVWTTDNHFKGLPNVRYFEKA